MKLTTHYALIFNLFFLISLPLQGTELDRKDRSWTFSILFENDLFADTDRHYTNGIKLTWISPDLTRYREQVPEWGRPLVNHLPFIHESGLQRNVAFSIGQKIFTPADIERRDLIREDRPYAGWLYGAMALHNKNTRRLDSLEVQAGFVGPASLAERAQNFVHKVRGIDEAEGWDNQLNTEPGLVFIYERKWRMPLTQKLRRWGADLITHSGAALGNVYIYGNAGAELRYGWNIPTDFGTSLIRPGGDTHAPSDSSDPRYQTDRSRFSAYLFAAVSGRVVGRDIFLDGNSFSDSHSVDKKNLVGDALIGVSLLSGSFKLSYAQVYRSKEFRQQRDASNFGSISLAYSY